MRCLSDTYGKNIHKVGWKTMKILAERIAGKCDAMFDVIFRHVHFNVVVPVMI
jgi:hypothetical protein